MSRFVIQEHNASNLHWDFRLEIDGVLRSWAVPKGVPTQPGIKRLAVSVEDHPLDWLNFKGTIKEGYGKGTVKIWDSGKYEMVDEYPNKIEFDLEGRKCKGQYTMIKYKPGKWLIFKNKE